MPTEVVTELIRVGILGPIVIAIGWFCWQQHKTIEGLHKTIEAFHAAKAAETQQFVDRLFTLNAAWQNVLTANSNLLSDTVTTLDSVRTTLQDVNDTLKDVSRQQYALITASRMEQK